MRTIWIGLFSVTVVTAALPIGCGDTPETPTGSTSSGSGMGGSETASSSSTGSSSTASSSSSGMGGAASSSSAVASSSSSAAASSSSSGSSASSSSSSGSSASSSSSGGGVDGGALINGCDVLVATDKTGMAKADISFGVGGFTYSPKCLKVTSGTQVTFTGNFVFHPLVAGEIVGITKVPAAAGTSPLPTNAGGLNSGMAATFTMQPAGTYPYYCDVHGTSGMNGVIFVVP